MNIQIQATSLVFIILLIIFYKVQPKLGLYSERLYLHVLITCMITLIFDITSIIVIIYRDSIYMLLVEFICKAYLVCLILNGFYAFYYALSDISYPNRLKLRIVTASVMILMSVVVCILPIDYYSDGSATYTLGPAVLSTYGFTLFFIILTMIFCLTQKKRINTIRRKAILWWMGIWVAFATIQFLNNSFLIVGLGCAVGSVILFFFLENPDSYIDKNLGCFNSNALTRYLDHIIEIKKSCPIIILNFNNEEKKDASNGMEFMRWIIEKGGSEKDVRIFKNIHSELWMIFDSMHDYTLYRSLVATEMEKQEKQVILVKDSNIFSSSDELTKVISYTEIEDMILLTRGIRNITIEDIIDYNAENRIKADIIEALEDDRIEIFIQPIYSTLKEHFVSGEVLARMRTKDNLIVPPGIFIPVAERSGLIKEIGERVFRKACKFISESNLQSYGIDYLEVNLAVEHGESEELLDSFVSIMKEYSINPKMLNLEITETGSIRNRERFMKNMEKFRALGVELSLDDFGSGESNLDYIIQMPVSIVKFDKQMIDEYNRNVRAKFVVHHITDMAHEMGLMIVAEGVETKDQLDEMRRIGIDFIQGYYFSKPVPTGDFLTFISAQ